VPAVTLHVVPHTHWDREWYEPFEAYRFRLVQMVDQLLAVMASDPGFTHFNFDGQTAAIEDYLEIRPDAEPVVSALVREGRLAVGPWRILMDEFLCSPETIVRNLEQGAAMAGRLGRRQRLGYIPDSFGHIAQMPQLLNEAGLTEAVTWRGVPAAVDRSVFRWIAPDGSSVRAAYLATSYSNAASLPDALEDLLIRGKRIVEDLAPFAPGGILLAMNGSDHRPPQAHLPALLAEANGAQDEIAFRLGSMEQYLAAAPDEDLPVWHGEMRSHARANLLPGVLSARVPLKLAEFRASTLLERYAEPLAAIAGADPGLLLERAWRGMVENSAHDSVCGCGIDEVAAQVLGRYVEAARVADLVATDALAHVAARVDAARFPSGIEGVVVWNPTPAPRQGIVEVDMTPPVGPDRLAFRARDGTAVPAQVLQTTEQVAIDMTLTGEQLARIVPTVHSRLLADLYVNRLHVEEGRTTTVYLRMGPIPEGAFDVEGGKRAIESLLERKPRGRFRVLGIGPALSRVLVATPPIGGLGWSTLEPVDGPVAVAEPAVADGHVLHNGILRAEVDAAGRVALLHVPTGTRYPGLFGIEDGADAGDEYNYSPPATDLIVGDPAEAAVVEELRHGPLEAALRVTTRYRIPVGLTANERARARRTTFLPVELDLSLRTGEPFLRARIAIHNDARDHRVRALFPVPFAASSSHADGAFHVVERGLDAEGAAHEHGLPTYPARRWVDLSDGAAGLAVLHRGTPEYEVLDQGRMLAVTLLRAVGWLSRQGMAYRAGPAGPALATPGAQLLGPHRFDLALYPHAGDWQAAAVHDACERYAYPMRAAVLRAQPGDLPPDVTMLTLEPDAVQLSALRRDPGGVTLRVYNSSASEVTARIQLGEWLPRARASRTGLLGDDRGNLEVAGGIVAVPLRPWEIATIRLA